MQAVRNESAGKLKVWEKIRIIVGSGLKAGVYEARIEDIINGGIVVTDPAFVSGKTLLRQDAQVAVQITRKDAAYQFESRIKKQTGGPRNRIILTPPRRLTRIQRRKFARVEHLAGLRYGACRFDMNWTDWRKKISWKEGFASNISGGGILMAVDEGLAKGDLAAFSIDLFLDAGLSPYILGESRRTYEDEGKRFSGIQFLTTEALENSLPQQLFTKIPIQFREFTLRSQDKLATYVFQVEIEQRKKGLI